MDTARLWLPLKSYQFFNLKGFLTVSPEKLIKAVEIKVVDNRMSIQYCFSKEKKKNTRIGRYREIGRWSITHLTNFYIYGWKSREKTNVWRYAEMEPARTTAVSGQKEHTGYELHNDKNFRGIIQDGWNNCKFNHWQRGKKIVKYQYKQW